MNQALYFNPTDAAAQIGVHRNTLGAHIKAGNILVRRLGRRVEVPAEEINRIQREGLPKIRWPVKSVKNEDENAMDPADKRHSFEQITRSAHTESKLAALSQDLRARTQKDKIPFRGINLSACTEKEWRKATGMSFFPPHVRARLSYIAGTDPDKPKLPLPATAEELAALREDMVRLGVTTKAF